MKTATRSANRLQRGGFLFFELLFAIGMLAVASLLGAEVFRIASRAVSETVARQTSQLQLDQAMRHLRADVWDASALEPGDNHTLRIRTAGNEIIRWKTNGALTRIAADAARNLSWDRINAKVTFAVRGPTVTVGVEEGPNAVGHVVIISQGMLLQGGGR